MRIEAGAKWPLLFPGQQERPSANGEVASHINNQLHRSHQPIRRHEAKHAVLLLSFKAILTTEQIKGVMLRSHLLFWFRREFVSSSSSVG